MSEWAMAHPWLTFFVAVWALCVLDSIVANICRAIIGGKKPRGILEPKEKTDHGKTDEAQQ